MEGERARQHDKIELIASENYVFAAVMEAQGSWLTNKYAEGLPGKRYYGGCEFVDVAERLAQERALRALPGGRARQRPAPQRRPGQHGRLHVDRQPRRPGPRHEPGPRRPPHPRDGPQLQRPLLRDPRLRRPPGHRADRLRRPGDAGEGDPAEAHHRRRLRLPPDHRLPADGRHRPFGRRAPVGRHGPHRRARRGGPPPEPLPARRPRDDDDPQDPPRRPRRPDLQPQDAPRGDRPGRLPDGQAGPRRDHRPERLPRRPGRSAHARHRGQGGGLPAQPHRGIPASTSSARSTTRRSWPRPSPSRAPAW